MRPRSTLRRALRSRRSSPTSRGGCSRSAGPFEGALQLAIRERLVGVVMYLLGRGASPNAAVAGEWPLDLLNAAVFDLDFDDGIAYALRNAGADYCGFLSTVKAPTANTDVLRRIAGDCAAQSQ